MKWLSPAKHPESLQLVLLGELERFSAFISISTPRAPGSGQHSENVWVSFLPGLSAAVVRLKLIWPIIFKCFSSCKNRKLFSPSFLQNDPKRGIYIHTEMNIHLLQVYFTLYPSLFPIPLLEGKIQND